MYDICHYIHICMQKKSLSLKRFDYVWAYTYKHRYECMGTFHFSWSYVLICVCNIELTNDVLYSVTNTFLLQRETLQQQLMHINISTTIEQKVVLLYADHYPFLLCIFWRKQYLTYFTGTLLAHAYQKGFRIRLGTQFALHIALYPTKVIVLSSCIYATKKCKTSKA